MKKFEYATAVFDTTTFLVGSKLNQEKFHAKLNEYGQEGWELVNVFSMDRGAGTYQVTAVFKREVTV